jgi:uncharacterized protein
MKEIGNARIESGSMGRVAYARISPNEDLVQSIEKCCLEHGFHNAFVRGALGSLTDANLYLQNGSIQFIKGPAVEIVSLAGEVRLQQDASLRASISGVVADPRGRIRGGPFVSGQNLVCITVEVTLEEWIPSSENTFLENQTIRENPS